MHTTVLLQTMILALATFALNGDSPYLVLVDPGKDGEYLEAAQAMAALHDGEVMRFHPEKREETLAALRRARPGYVVFVLPPEQIDVDLCHAVLETAVRVDDDPFTDFQYGFVTGRDGRAALRFVLRIQAARSREFGGKAALFGSWEGAFLPGNQPLTALETLGFSAELDLVKVGDPEAERKKKAKEALSGYGGADILLFFSHGYPDAMGSCFHGADLRRWQIDLSPAVLINCACYNGAPGRWYFPGPKGMEDRGVVKPEDSVALAILDAGVSAYIAGIDPWHGPLANQVFCYLADDGMRLGGATKRMFDRLALAFLPGRIRYEPTIKRRFHGEGADNRRHNGAGMILYGDPAWAPFAKNAKRLMFTEREEMTDGKTRLRLGTRPLIGNGPAGVDFMLPLNRLTDYYSVKTQNILQELSMEIYRVIPLAPGSPARPALHVVSAKAGTQDVPFKEPQAVVEETPRGRLLHIRVPLDVRPVGSLWPLLIARKGITVVLEGEL